MRIKKTITGFVHPKERTQKNRHTQKKSDMSMFTDDDYLMMHAVAPDLSPSNAKTITLIRHGVAHHNLHDEQTGAKPNLRDPKFTDSPLTQQGKLQAIQLGERLKRRGVVCPDGDTVNISDASDSNNAGCTSSENVNNPMNGDGMDLDVGVHNYNGNCGSKDAQTIELVICSPLTRCLQTASHIFPSYFHSSCPSSDEQFRSGVFVLDKKCRVCCHGDVREAYGINYSDKRR